MSVQVVLKATTMLMAGEIVKPVLPEQLVRVVEAKHPEFSRKPECPHHLLLEQLQYISDYSPEMSEYLIGEVDPDALQDYPVDLYLPHLKPATVRLLGKGLV